MRDTTKKELYHDIKSIMDQYCEGCFLNQHIKKESGRRAAHRFCITKCTVGEQIKEYGKKLQ